MLVKYHHHRLEMSEWLSTCPPLTSFVTTGVYSAPQDISGPLGLSKGSGSYWEDSLHGSIPSFMAEFCLVLLEEYAKATAHRLLRCCCLHMTDRRFLNMGTVIIKIGFGGLLYYSYKKEPPKPILIIKAPILPAAHTLPLLTTKTSCDLYWHGV